jgi:hypothetical protein
MRLLKAIFWILIVPVASSAWGEKGHIIVNTLAIDAAASKLPDFMKAARNDLIYNGNEPDRWRDEINTPMNIAQAADHFFDSELWGPIGTIESDRYMFMEKVAAKKVALIRVGYLPYAIIEHYGRLVNAFRHWRNATTPEVREAARADAVHYAGVMGHYVADAAQPMHMSVHYNGWLDNVPNPNNYTRDRGLHARYEAGYVDAAIDAATVRTKVQAPERLKDVFGSIKQHLIQGFNELEPMYQLEKTGEFNPEQPRPKGTAFIATEIARGATMLSNLWYTAWLESGEPLPTR